MESQLGADYNAGDECCALARGKSLFPLIRSYKAADTIEDGQRTRVVLTVGAATLAHNQSNHLHVRLSAHGRGVGSTGAGARHPPPPNRDDALVGFSFECAF